ncbi:MAG: hypothetical protein ACRDPW_09755 [Mycobacteriales bacterium]
MSECLDWDWNTSARDHIENRHVRDGSDDIATAWTQEAWDDPDRLMYDPDPRNRGGGRTIRCIGYTPSGERIVTVIVMRIDEELFGITAYTTTGSDLQHYLEGRGND